MTHRTQDKIKDALISGELTPNFIAKIYGVHKNTVYAFQKRLVAEGIIFNDTSKGVCGMLPRLESYFTEEELLYPILPFYGAENKHLITPINPEWKLY